MTGTLSPDGKWLWDGKEWIPAPPTATAAQLALETLLESFNRLRELPKSETGVIFFFCPTASLNRYFLDEHDRENWEFDRDEWRSKWRFCNETFNHLKKLIKERKFLPMEDYGGPSCLDNDDLTFSDGRKNYHYHCDWHFPIPNNAYNSNDRLIKSDGTLLHPDFFSAFQMDQHGELVELDAEFFDTYVYDDDYIEDEWRDYVKVNGEACEATGIRLKEKSDVISPQDIDCFFLFKSRKTLNYYFAR